MEKLPIHTDHSGSSNTGSNTGNNIGNKWPDVEQALTEKSRQVENMGRDYISHSPFKSVFAVGAAGLLLGYLISKFRV